MECPDGSSRWNIRMLQHRWRIQMIHMPAHMHFQHFYSSPHSYVCCSSIIGAARSAACLLLLISQQDLLHKANSASTPKKLHQSPPSARLEISTQGGQCSSPLPMSA